MDSDNIDNIIIWVIVLTIIGDFLALFVELLGQRFEKKAKREQEEKEKKLTRSLRTYAIGLPY
jgi:phosphate/sulfate permease